MILDMFYNSKILFASLHDISSLGPFLCIFFRQSVNHTGLIQKL